MSREPSVIVTVSGADRPGIGALLWQALGGLDLPIIDIEQITVRGQLLLCAEVEAPSNGDVERIEVALADSALARQRGIDVSARRFVEAVEEIGTSRQLVTLVAAEIKASALEGVFSAIALLGGTVERIQHLSSYPVISYELVVSVDDAPALRTSMLATGARLGIDVAVQRAGLYRRAKHLICMDVDSTLLQGEVIDMLAARAGCEEQVAAITARAMAGELDFEQSLRSRVALLQGLPETVLADLAGDLVLSPGARTLVRTLFRLGYVPAIVSGGFTQVIEPLAADLGIEFFAANTLEVVDGVLTGGLVGDIVDRPGKAAALRRFAAHAGVPLNQTVAIGDGANDIDMLAAAGLGIAYNAKPVVRHAADTALNVPYLDAVLFFLGISRREIEAADLDDA